MRLFLKEQRAFILIYFFSVGLTTFYCLLSSDFTLREMLYPFLFNSFILLVFLIWKFVKAKEVYTLISSGIRTLESSAVERGSSFWARHISRLLKQQHHLYEERIQQSDKNHQEHLTFINQWVHQMKTPLSVIKLHLEADGGSARAFDIQEELYKIEKGLNLALSLARIDEFEKDFVIEKAQLQPLIRDCITREKKLFIASGILPKAVIDETLEVYTDVKWLSFVVEQLLTNGIKYSKGKSKVLTISAYRSNHGIVLEVADEGIGIHPKDIRRVFDPFFTGENGRLLGESTGMGLYLAQKVCNNLNHRIDIQSEVNRGTKVSIYFENTAADSF